MKNWKRRYFVLDENSLNYYKTDMVRKRRRAQTRWRQCKDASRCSQTDTEEEESEKICACCKTCCVSPHAEACVLNTSSCHLRVDRLRPVCAHIWAHPVCVCVHMCVWLSVHTFLCVIMSWVSAAAAEGLFFSWKLKKESLFQEMEKRELKLVSVIRLTSISHIHAGSVSTLEVFGSLINPVKRTPESFCKVRRVIYLPLFVKSSRSSLTSMFTHRLPCVHADICLHAIAADCESYRPTRSSIEIMHIISTRMTHGRTIWQSNNPSLQQ